MFESPSTPSARYTKIVVQLAIFLGCIVCLSPHAADPDLWGHVQYGLDWIREGRLPRESTYTFTAVGYRWINHENLSELTMAGLYRWLGVPGLLAARAILGLGIVAWVMVRAERQRVAWIVAAVWTVLTAYTLTWFWAIRPQLATYGCLVAMIACLDRAFSSWYLDRRVQWRYLMLYLPVHVLWTNAHGGFLAGAALLTAYLGIRILEQIYWHGRDAWRTVAALTGYLLLIGLASCLNPYGPELIRWVISAVTTPRPEISEWAVPRADRVVFWPFLVTAILGMIAWIFSVQRRDAAQGILLLILLWQAWTHERHIALFALLAAAWTPLHLDSAWRRILPQHDGYSSRTSPLALVSVLVAVFMVVAMQVRTLYGSLGEIPVSRGQYPVDAIEFIAEQQVRGRLTVAFNWAQYAIAALEPNVQVSLDGRIDTCYPQEAIDVHFDFLHTEDLPRYRDPQSGPIDPHRVLTYGEPELMLVDRRYPQANRVMAKQDRFVLLYQDRLAQVWGLKEVFDDPANPRYLAPQRRSIGQEYSTQTVAWPARP